MNGSKIHYIFCSDGILNTFFYTNIKVWKLESKWMVTETENLRRLKFKRAVEKTENQPTSPPESWKVMGINSMEHSGLEGKVGVTTRRLKEKLFQKHLIPTGVPSPPHTLTPPTASARKYREKVKLHLWTGVREHSRGYVYHTKKRLN